MRLVEETVVQHGVAPTCAALGVARATYYRRQRPKPEAKPRPTSPRALSPVEREQVLAVLHEESHVNLAPAQVYAKLLDEREQ
jgi:putative transposase